MNIFNKIYHSEDISDIGRDVSEAFDPAYNPKVSGIPQDGYGFHTGGHFVVTINWIEDEQKI